MMLTSLAISTVVGLLISTGDGQITEPPANQACLCLIDNSIDVWDAPCGNVIGTASTPECYYFLGSQHTCAMAGTDHTFYSLDHNSKIGWFSGDFLRDGNLEECIREVDLWRWAAGNCSDIQIVTREEWGARPPSEPIPTIPLPVNYLFIHHTAQRSCVELETCCEIVRAEQNYHMDVNGWWDLGYNYVIGEDGRAYEGRGWDKEGAHTLGHNSVAVAISVLGLFTDRRPMDIAMNAVNNLIDCALQQNVIISDFKMGGHTDAGTTVTECPGNSFYPQIQTWPYYCFDIVNATYPAEPCESRPSKM